MSRRLNEEELDVFCDCGEPLFTGGELEAGRCVECLVEKHEEDRARRRAVER